MYGLEDLEDILVPIAFFATAIAIIFIIFKYLSNDKKRRYAVIEKAIESGQQIPENFLIVKKAEKSSFDYFKSGIIFTFLAVAFWLAYLLGNDDRTADKGFGLMFVAAFFSAFGLAFILIGLLRRNQEKTEVKTTDE
ncbi:MAG: DUF6249 domain-containing protein [Paludibacter sp.]|nr:DUF6249 domain-containing protein [Paludibacter sp.]